MNKWEERLCDKNDNRQLLIESSEFTSKIKLNKTLKESLIMQSGKNGTLIVKNVPVTILDRENLNGRIYSTETMRQAIEEAREAMADKQTLGQANEHPESSFVAPTDASHVIINAYIKENINIVVDGKRERHNVLFTDWEVLNTTHGKDLRALFEAECSFGTSIRGVGELNGKMVENYSFISVDGVGNPSSSTYTRMPVSESVKVEFKDANELKENYTVMSSSTNVVRDLSQAGILQQQLNANPYGTITKTSTKVDQETDPKTGAQTSITTVEADTEDEVNDLSQAFAMAQKAMTNGISKVNSVTIEANEDEDEQGNKTESVGSDNGLEAYVPESAPIKEGQVVAQGQPEGIEFLKTLDEKERYMFLDRMKTDCDYFLGMGNHHNRCLWAHNPEKQIEYMKWLWNSFPENKKPKWISLEDIENYETQMIGTDKEDYDVNSFKFLNTNSGKIYSSIEDLVDNFLIKGGYCKDEDRDKTIELVRKECESYNSYDGNDIIRFGYNSFRLIPEDRESKSIYTDESTITESKKEEPKDPNEGRQYVLKIKDNDPKIEEGAEDEPEFVAMRGNAIRFTKDPKKALHFTQGMEESGIVHYSNIQKLLADMGYGEQNLEKWYKRDENQSTSNNKALPGAVASKPVKNTTMVDPKEESAKLTEAGNTKYSATMELINGAGLPDMKSLDISSVDLAGAKEELGNHCDQQDSSSDGRRVTKAILIDNQSKKRYEYKRDTKELVPENGVQAQQPVQQKAIEEPVDNDIKIMNPEEVKLGTKEESADGEIKQNDKTLDMDIDDNTHVEKEFDTQAQASVAKAGIESGKLSGDVLLSDAVDDDWKICVVFDNLDYDDEELLYNNADSTSGQQVFNGDKPDKIRVTLYPDELNDAHSAIEIFALARKKLKDNLGISARPHIYDFNIFDKNEKFNDGIADLPESTNDIKPGWYVAHDKIGISGPYETREACMEGLEDYKDQVSVYEVTENDLNEVLFNKPSEPSDDYVEKPLDEEEVVYESSLVPVRFSNIKWDEKDAAYRMFEDIEKDMRISHIEPDVNNANILVEYFENYMNDLNNVSVSYDVNPSNIKESVNYQEEIIRLYNEDSSRQYPKIESADINLG